MGRNICSSASARLAMPLVDSANEAAISSSCSVSSRDSRCRAWSSCCRASRWSWRRSTSSPLPELVRIASSCSVDVATEALVTDGSDGDPVEAEDDGGTEAAPVAPSCSGSSPLLPPDRCDPASPLPFIRSPTASCWGRTRGGCGEACRKPGVIKRRALLRQSTRRRKSFPGRHRAPGSRGAEGTRHLG